METVEKWVKPLNRLHFGLWKNCGRRGQNIHTPVEKKPIPLYIRLFPARFLPATTVYSVYFLPIAGHFGGGREWLHHHLRRISTNPQPVDKSFCGRRNFDKITV